MVKKTSGLEGGETQSKRRNNARKKKARKIVRQTSEPKKSGSVCVNWGIWGVNGV